MNTSSPKLSKSEKRLRQKEQRLARIEREIQRESHLARQVSRNNRKARTRTLIQLGGLLEKAGLVSCFDIELGEDLQLDETALKKATILLGALSDYVEHHLNPQKPAQKTKQWHQKGKQLLSKAH